MKKFAKVISVLISTLMTIIIIVGIVFIALYALKIKPYVVQSGSMEPKLHVGSVCFINEKVPYEKIKENDIIAFETNGMLTTHRVINITEKGFETKGDANNSPDGPIITPKQYKGKNIFSIPKLGYIINNIRNPIVSLMIFALFIVLVIIEILYKELEKNIGNPIETTTKHKAKRMK